MVRPRMDVPRAKEGRGSRVAFERALEIQPENGEALRGMAALRG